MTATDATRLLLFTDARRTAAEIPPAKVRRYRLARLRLEGFRQGGEPRYAYLKRGHD